MVGEPEVVRIRLVRSTGCRLYLTDMDAIAAVVRTGIYCRPGCGAQPQARNVRTFSLAAAAEAAGYRACLRCRPYRTSLPVAWTGPELVCRAVQLILDGALDQGTEATLGLARRADTSVASSWLTWGYRPTGWPAPRVPTSLVGSSTIPT